MGHRLEYFLAIVLLAVLATPSFLKVDKFKNENRVVSSNKSTEIKDFTQYDINRTSIEYRLTANLAEKRGDSWYLANPEIINGDIKSLRAKRSVSKGNKITFIDNVLMVKNDGKRYNSQKAIYDTETKVVTTPDRFTISKEYDMVNGVNMKYNSVTKETKAKNVKATFVLKKSD